MQALDKSAYTPTEALFWYYSYVPVHCWELQVLNCYLRSEQAEDGAQFDKPG